jgi:hypothetical protein
MQLIEDRTYFVREVDAEIVACPKCALSARA